MDEVVDDSLGYRKVFDCIDDDDDDVTDVVVITGFEWAKRVIADGSIDSTEWFG